MYIIFDHYCTMRQSDIYASRGHYNYYRRSMVSSQSYTRWVHKRNMTLVYIHNYWLIYLKCSAQISSGFGSLHWQSLANSNLQFVNYSILLMLLWQGGRSGQNYISQSVDPKKDRQYCSQNPVKTNVLQYFNYFFLK